MKTMHKVTSLLAILGLLLTLWTPMTLSAESAVSPYAATAPQDGLLYFGRSMLEKMDNGQALCYAYDKLAEGLQREQKEIDISHRTHVISWSEAEIVCEVVRADHPELFGVSSIGFTGTESCVSTFYGYYDAAALSYTHAVNRRVEQLTAGLNGKSDYEKSLILHDRLCDAVVYEFSDHNQTAVGSLALGASVCAGYARGYQLLMQAVGIPCFYVVGYSRDQGHAWNLVQLDGEWYYTDVTWDDQNDTAEDGSGIYYSYLNVTYEQISKDHEASEFVEYLPKSTATANNYYIKNGLLIEPNKPLDVKKLAAAFKENYPPQLYYTGDNVAEGAQLIFNNLQKIVKEIMGKKPYTGINAQAGMLGNGIIIYLEIVHDHQFSSTTIPASCMVKGVKTNRCNDCGYTTKEAIPATGHSQTIPWQDDTYHGYQCAGCGMTEALEVHRFEKDGITCDTCGYVAKECHHQYDTVTVEPTCTSDGYTSSTCIYCGDTTETEILPATGHVPCDVPGQEPTCIFPGYTVWSYCVNCGEILTASETIPALPHDFSGFWQDETAHGSICIHCNHWDYLEAHTYQQDGKTCDTCGYVSAECHHRYIKPCGRCCQFCGEERLIDVAHTYDNDKDADCNFCGEEREIVTATPGDANGDGKVNNRDLGLLQRYLNDSADNVDFNACDVNGDGKVNNRDLGLLQRQLNT